VLLAHGPNVAHRALRGRAAFRSCALRPRRGACFRSFPASLRFVIRGRAVRALRV